MRILQVLPHLSKGGAERVVIELSNALVANGHEVTLLLALQVDPVLNQQHLSSKVQIEIVSPQFGNRFLQYLSIPIWVVKNRKLLRTYDVVHCHLTFGLVFGFIFSITRKLWKRTHVRLVATCHVVGVGVSRAPRMINETLSIFFDSFVLMAMDDHWRNFINKKNRKNIQVIRNGISHFSPSNSKLDLSVTQRWKFEQSPNRHIPVIGTISRLQSERKPWLFLEVFAEVQRLTDFEVHFLLGGEGPEREALNQLAYDFELTKSLSMPGLVQDPHTFLVALDLYVALNVEETTGIAGLEAVFAGVPVVGIQLSQKYSRGNKDWIWSDVDPKIVGRQIAKYLMDSKQLPAVASSQFTLAKEKYSIVRMLDEYLNLYSNSK
jgi:glycosyltransferase involved in cell wall biosynthesis